MIFDPTYPSPDSLSSGFRVFVSSNTPCNTPASQAPKPPGEQPQLSIITIADTHKVDKDGFHISGGGAWFGTNNPCNKSIKVPEHLAAPGTREIVAILSVISTLPTNISLQLMIKSSVLWKSLTTNLANLEDIDWLDHPNKTLMKSLVASLRK
ncbi:hypothetical protein BDR06DRAFT_878365 [Suillus hirtellus]|nr:hypothetical protein BDR06DRAFT_878365 [Suillus hirtellus]